MYDYRLYSLKNGNQIDGPARVVQCASDQEAIAEAKKVLNGLDIEVWQGARIVGRLQPRDK